MPMNPRLLVPRAAGSFDPRKIGGLVGWWDASNASTLTYNGSTISQWNDLSGAGVSGRNFVQSTAANQPGTTTVNGRNALTFNGTNSWMRQSALSSYANGTTIAVFSRNGTNARYGCVWGYRSSSTNALSDLPGASNSDAFVQLANQNSTTNSGTLNIDVISTSTPSAVVNGTAVTLGAAAWGPNQLSTSGVETAGVLAVVTVNTGQTASGNKMILLGVEGVTVSRIYGMTLCELLVYSAALSTSARQSVERWLGKKWGVVVA